MRCHENWPALTRNVLTVLHAPFFGPEWSNCIIVFLKLLLRLKLILFQVKIAFGTEWKESLAELSGGQRSLVALSLILSLLLFKPAPIYILDEVDAALDLSHTQNIGNMLRTHFQQSQVSAKVSLHKGFIYIT